MNRRTFFAIITGGISLAFAAKNVPAWTDNELVQRDLGKPVDDPSPLNAELYRELFPLRERPS